ncbi:hypothetical protein OIE68_32165 [Nocardia vinacea]|uniref:hypothetical protein n=1 Tax=Nocardia vinacea TaxID=96468 RepID=UPI002E11402C|nr:hypothetical protein OIE68_32165 [Nocardia vinacea]
MTLGALVAAVAGKAFLGNRVGFIGDLAGPSAIALGGPRVTRLLAQDGRERWAARHRCCRSVEVGAKERGIVGIWVRGTVAESGSVT